MIQMSEHSIFSIIMKGFYKLLSLWRYWLFPFIMIVMAYKAGYPILLKELTMKCFLSVGYALGALFILYFGVYALVNLICLIQEKFAVYHQKIHALIVFLFLIIIILNVFPMVFWIKYYKSPLLLPFYLILSNMLLYYYCFHTYSEIHDERQKLYVTSARFKGTTQYDYLKEKRQWVMLNNIRPMFYHLFSFTLFTDYLVLDSKSSGIVGYIFLQLKNGNKTFTNELMLALGVSICVLYPIKKLLEFPEARFARNHTT